MVSDIHDSADAEEVRVRTVLPETAEADDGFGPGRHRKSAGERASDSGFGVAAREFAIDGRGTNTDRPDDESAHEHKDREPAADGGSAGLSESRWSKFGRDALTTASVLATIGSVGTETLPKPFVANDSCQTTISAVQDRATSEQQQLWRDGEELRREREDEQRAWVPAEQTTGQRR